MPPSFSMPLSMAEMLIILLLKMIFLTTGVVHGYAVPVAHKILRMINKRQPYKNDQTNWNHSSATAGKLFEYVWPFCGLKHRWNFRVRVISCQIKMLWKPKTFTIDDLIWLHGSTIIKPCIAERSRIYLRWEAHKHWKYCTKISQTHKKKRWILRAYVHVQESIRRR